MNNDGGARDDINKGPEKTDSGSMARHYRLLPVLTESPKRPTNNEKISLKRWKMKYYIVYKKKLGFITYSSVAF